MEDKEILKQFKEISNNLMSRCSPDSDIYPLVTALISLFNLVINITQGLKEHFESQINPSSRKFLCLHIFCRHISLYKSL